MPFELFPHVSGFSFSPVLRTFCMTVSEAHALSALILLQVVTDYVETLQILST